MHFATSTGRVYQQLEVATEGPNDIRQSVWKTAKWPPIAVRINLLHLSKELSLGKISVGPVRKRSSIIFASRGTVCAPSDT